MREALNQQSELSKIDLGQVLLVLELTTPRSFSVFESRYHRKKNAKKNRQRFALRGIDYFLLLNFITLE